MSAPTTLELLREAMAAARANDKSLTRQLLVEATRLDPANETAWLWLADVAESPQETVVALERVLALDPGNEKAKTALRPARLKAGIAAAKAKDVPTARRLLRAAVADDPGSEYGWLWLASVSDSPAEGLSHLQKVLAINPNNAAARKGVDYYQGKLNKSPAGIGPSPRTPSPTPPGAVPSPVPPASKPPLPRRPTPAGSKTVLVVDASRTIRKLVGITLAMDGFRAVEAADVPEAADRFREDGVPDLLVVDVAVPGADVYDFCQLVRGNPEAKPVAIFLLTGKDGRYDTFRAKVAGINAFLTKPLHPELLLQTARSHCRPEPAVTG